ncbi:hypothetical protein Tco_0733789 [Tanacetum coccineum]
MPWASEKEFIYIVVPNIVNNAKLYDIDKTGIGIVKGNILYTKEESSEESSRLLRYAKSKPNEKLIYNSIMHGPYVRRLIPEPCDPDREVHVAETLHEQTDDELTDKEVKQMEADDQAIQIILMGLLKDIYAAVDSCETA